MQEHLQQWQHHNMKTVAAIGYIEAQVLAWFFKSTHNYYPPQGNNFEHTSSSLHCLSHQTPFTKIDKVVLLLLSCVEYIHGFT